MKALSVFCLMLSSLAAAPLANRVHALISASPVARNAFWGIEVRDLKTNAILFRLNEERFFVPASNTKLFTTALALTRLGAGFQVRTLVTSNAEPNAQGLITGDLSLIGAGDANLSGRPIPYDPEGSKLDPLTAMRDLASQLYARGIRSISGGVIGDDTAFEYEPYPPGWSVDDPVTSDGAPVSALAVCDNTISLTVTPTQITFAPAVPVFTVDNRVAVGTAHEIHIARDPGSTTLRLWGTMPSTDTGETNLLAVDDPARYAALALIAALREAGITVAGEAMARHRYAGTEYVPQNATALASHGSPALLEDLRITDKVSQNLHAEMLLRQVGHGSRKEGLKAMEDFAAEAGLDSKSFSFTDGSGLSRLNVVTPHALVQLLAYMARTPLAVDFASLLPVSGMDGSLRLRFANSRAKGRVFAKTGSLSHTSALSGYAVRRNGRTLAFSILANNYNGSTAEVRSVIDRICALLVE